MMDAFLAKKGSPTRVGVAGKDLRTCMTKSAASNLLFNPQPKRFVFPTHNPRKADDRNKGPPLGGGGASGYWQFRTSKLVEQAPLGVSNIFAGLSFYFNGRSGDKQTMHLKGAVSKYGGRTTPFMSMKGVTHVIAENLSGVKTDKAMKSLKMKVVHPDWLNRCIEEGKLLPDAPFRVVRSQKLGMGNFFASSSSASPYCRDSSKGSSNDGQKENKREEKSKRRRSFPGKTPAVITGDVVDGRKGEKRRRDQRGLSGGEARGECGTTVKARSSIEYRDRSRKDTRDVGIRAKGNSFAPESKRTHQSSKGGSSTSSSREGVRGSRKDRSAVGDVADRGKRCSEGFSSIHGRSGSAKHGSTPQKHCMREATTHDMAATTARKRSRHAAAAVATDAEIRNGSSGFQELDYREDDDVAGDASAASRRGAQHV